MRTLGRVAPQLARRALALAVIPVLATGAPANPAHAQAGSGTVWVALDSQAAGTPAQVILNDDLSSPTQTWFDVTISGFYATTRVGPDGIIYRARAGANANHRPALRRYVDPGARTTLTRAE